MSHLLPVSPGLTQLVTGQLQWGGSGSEGVGQGSKEGQGRGKVVRRGRGRGKVKIHIFYYITHTQCYMTLCYARVRNVSAQDRSGATQHCPNVNSAPHTPSMQYGEEGQANTVPMCTQHLTPRAWQYGEEAVADTPHTYQQPRPREPAAAAALGRGQGVLPTSSSSRSAPPSSW